MINYLNVLVKYHRIDYNIATLKKRIEKYGLEGEIGNTNRTRIDKSETEAGTHSGWIA